MEDLKNNINEVDMMKSDPGPFPSKKEKNKLYNQSYYLKNKEYWKTDCSCECGLTYKRASKNKHCKGKEHVKRMANKEMSLPPIEIKECEIHLEGFEKIVDCIKNRE